MGLGSGLRDIDVHGSGKAMSIHGCLGLESKYHKRLARYLGSTLQVISRSRRTMKLCQKSTPSSGFSLIRIPCS